MKVGTSTARLINASESEVSQSVPLFRPIVKQGAIDELGLLPQEPLQLHPNEAWPSWFSSLLAQMQVMQV